MSLVDASKSASPMSVRFWGVRGSIACPGPDTSRYGGNTPCVEIRCGEQVVIFDAGTGIRALGDALGDIAKRGGLDVVLSHCHIDHIVGFPFFAPLFSKDQVVRVWGNLQSNGGIEDAVRKFMSFPFFPLQIESLRAKVEFRNFRAGDTIAPRPGIASSSTAAPRLM
jgi:phosphoribosyl 1,2-cyclic phosphodiesterase